MANKFKNGPEGFDKKQIQEINEQMKRMEQEKKKKKEVNTPLNPRLNKKTNYFA